MKECWYCGMPLPDSARKCPYCHCDVSSERGSYSDTFKGALAMFIISMGLLVPMHLYCDWGDIGLILIGIIGGVQLVLLLISLLMMLIEKHKH